MYFENNKNPESLRAVYQVRSSLATTFNAICVFVKWKTIFHDYDDDDDDDDDDHEDDDDDDEKEGNKMM